LLALVVLTVRTGTMATGMRDEFGVAAILALRVSGGAKLSP
jgi:hypothetical protein